MLLKILVVVLVAGLCWLALRRLGEHPTLRTQRTTLTAVEAAAILGISVSSPKAEIKAAHRRLIAANHPDKGGSDFLAQQINEARDVLMAAERKRS
ncbi:MAG: DnaJ domain-containing protein [Pseudomonadales bacterium]